MVKNCEETEEDSDAKDDKTITAVGLLSTIDSILSVMEGKLEVRDQINDTKPLRNDLITRFIDFDRA